MIRYTLFVMTILGTAATAIASVKPATPVFDPAAVTVVYQNDVSPLVMPAKKLVLEQCGVEDCSDTIQG